MKKYLWVMLLLTGCNVHDHDPKLIETIDVGVFTDVSVVTTSFNESIKSVVKTDRGTFIIYGLPSVIKGEKATVNKYSDGSRYLCGATWAYCLLLRN